MNKLIRLLSPYKSFFVIALLALTLSSLFNAALTGLVTPLMDGVLTNSAPVGESRAEQIFGFQDKIESLKNTLESWGLPISSITEESRKLDLINPLPWAILAFFVFSFQAIFEFIGTYFMGRIGVQIIVNLRQSLIDKIMFLSLNFFKRVSTGEIMSRINTDVLRIQNAVSVKFGELVKEATNSIVFLLLAFLINWKLSLTLFLIVPLVGVPIAIFTRKMRKYASKSQIYLGALTAHLKEVLVGIRIIKSFQKEAFESERLAERNHAFLKYALRELRVVALTTPIMSMIGMIVILAFVWYGGVLIQSGAMTRGDFLVYLLVIYQLYQPIKRIARANSEIQQAVGVLPRIEEILNWENEIVNPPNPKRFEAYPAIREIVFDDVSFRYQEDGVHAVHHFDLTVPMGAVVHLVGASGSGKSTLVNLLPRFYDIESGSIRINGLDIRSMAKSDLRALFAVVTQDTILFNDTVHNNIAYGMSEVSREAVIEAAQRAFAHAFIEEMPLGYETVIGEGGGNLSGGQRQRIAIARAILKNAPIPILDEATSALDSESEHEVRLALENLMATRTSFVVSHRLKNMNRAGEIIVMDKGRIVERGDHATLMAHDGFYRKYVNMQNDSGGPA